MKHLRWLALPLLVACGGPVSGGMDAGSLKCHERPLTYSGTPGQPQAAQVLSNIFAVPLKVGNSTATVVVDTGAPLVIIDPNAYPNEKSSLPALQGTVPRMESFGLRFSDAPVVATPLGLTLGDGLLGGLIGGELLCHFVSTFNYRDQNVTLGTGAAVLNVETPVTVTAPVEGGGGGLVPFPETRIAVTALVEGKERRFVIDTGASFTVFTPEFFNSLVADGHPSIQGPPASTVMGAVGTKLLRVKSLALGAAEAKNLVVGSVEGNLLPGLASEVGHPIDGLIGGTFLREFLVSMDYPNGKLTLSRYTTQTHVVDEFIRVGAALRLKANRQAGDPKYEVGFLFPNTDAVAKGLTVGTPVKTIDGQDLEALMPSQVDRLMVGKVGETRSFDLGTQVLVVKVDALL